MIRENDSKILVDAMIKDFGDEWDTRVNIDKVILKGVNINVQDKMGNNCLIIAAYLANHGPLADNSASKVVRYLLKLGGNPNLKNIDGFTSVHTAAMVNGLFVVEELIAGGAMLNVKSLKGKTPLDLAYDAGDVTMQSILLNAGAKRG